MVITFNVFTDLMPFESKHKKLVLTSEEVEKLTEISCPRTQPVRSVERAKIMLASYEGKSDSQSARELSAKEEIADKELNLYMRKRR